MIVVVVLFVLFALWAEKPSSSRPLAPITDPLAQAIANAPGRVLDASGLWPNGGMMLAPPPRDPNIIAGDPSSINGGYV